MFSQSVIFPASFVGPSTSASSVTRQSCKSVWRSHHQSTSSHRLWTNKPQSNSSRSWRSIVQRQSCRRALAWRQRLKPRLPERTKLPQRRETPWELDATQSPSWLNRRKLNSSSSLMTLTQLRWVWCGSCGKWQGFCWWKEFLHLKSFEFNPRDLYCIAYTLLETWPAEHIFDVN